MPDSEDKPIAGQAVARAIAWTSLGKYGGQAIRWASTLTVARFLLPSDYGMVGMTGLFAGLVALLAEFGVGTTALRMRSLTGDSLGRLHGLALLSGVASFLVGLAAAQPLSIFFSQPKLTNIVMVSAFGFILSSAQTVPLALLQRDHRFKDIAGLEFASAVASALLVLMLALAGAGYWALIVPNLVVSAAAATWLVRTVRISARFPVLSQIREAATFSAWVFASRIGGYLMFTMDFILVGRVLGEASLGSYQFAWSLANVPNDQVNGLVARVSGAFYSSSQGNHDEIARLYGRLLELVSLLTVPLTVGLALVAPEFIALTLGPNWGSAVVPLQVLCLFNATRASTILATPVLQMTGEVRFMTIVTLVGLAYLPILFWVLAGKYGASGVAFGWLIGYPPILFAILRKVSSKVGLGWRFIAGISAPSFVSSALMALAVKAIAWQMGESTVLWVRFTVMVLVGSATYVTAMLVVFPKQSRNIIVPLRNLIRGQKLA